MLSQNIGKTNYFQAFVSNETKGQIATYGLRLMGTKA